MPARGRFRFNRGRLNQHRYFFVRGMIGDMGSPIILGFLGYETGDLTKDIDTVLRKK